MTFNSHEHLVTGLIGSHLELYKTNAYFKANVDQLAQMLPIWVKGMAEEAEGLRKAHEAAVERIKNAPDISPYQLPSMYVDRTDDRQ